MGETLRDLQNMYGGRWYDFGATAGQPGWWRAPRIDPIGMPVWNPQYGWQDWRDIKKLNGDYSGLTPRFGGWEQYWQPKPTGTSDPELRAMYGSEWQSYLPGAEQQIKDYMASNPWQPQPLSTATAGYGSGPYSTGRPLDQNYGSIAPKTEPYSPLPRPDYSRDYYYGRRRNENRQYDRWYR